MTAATTRNMFPLLEGRRVFLAAPFTQLISPDDGRVSVTWENTLSSIRDLLLESDASVFSAHVREKWGTALMDPAEYTPLDFAEMRACDLVCAFLGSPPSGGVYIELGWASALGKPVLLFADEGTFRTPLIDGLTKLGNVTVVPVQDSCYEAALTATLTELGYAASPV